MDTLNQLEPHRWLAILTLLVLLMGVLLAVSLLKLRVVRQLQARQTEVLKSDMRALVSAAIGVGERVHRIEKSLKEVSHRQEVIDQTDPGAQAYQQAIKMAQKGSSIEELIDICGLTRGEAELIAMLHRMERSF